MIFKKKILPENKYYNADVEIYDKPIQILDNNMDDNKDYHNDKNVINVLPIMESDNRVEHIQHKDVLVREQPKQFFRTSKNDLNISQFKNTCLENLNISEKELGMLIYEKNKLTNKKFKESLNIYCHLKEQLNKYPNFAYIFPNIYITVLSYSFNINTTNSQFIDNIINLIHELDFNELSVIEVSLEEHPGSIALTKKNAKLFIQKPTRIYKTMGGTIKKRKTKNTKQKIQNKKRKTKKYKTKL
jgi:hypothetical protein